MSFNLLSQILRKPWLLRPSYAQSILPLIGRMMQHQDVTFDRNPKGVFSMEDDDEDRRPPKNKMILMIDSGVVTARRYSSFNDAPEGSLAMIPVVGPILKYGGECGEPGSIHMQQWTEEAKASSKIAGVIFKFDTPGGQVDGTATFADLIKNLGKPNVGFIDDGMSASAGMWLASACDRIVASQPTDEAGSIGVFTTIYDFKGWFEQEGIKLHEIYAPQSTDKNKDYREALEGDYKAVKESLKFIADRFIKVVKENRKGKINMEFDNPFTGKMYTAKDAISVGLIDDIASLSDVVGELSKKSTQKSNSGNQATGSNNSKNTMGLFGNNFPILQGMKKKSAEEITAEVLEAVNAELTVEGITSIQVVSKSHVEEATAKVSALSTKNVELQKKVDTLTARVTELEAEDGAGAVEPGKKKDVITEDPNKASEKIITGTKHMRDVENLIG